MRDNSGDQPAKVATGPAVKTLATKGPAALADAAARAERRAAALRENLKRRKQQARARAAGPGEDAAATGGQPPEVPGD